MERKFAAEQDDDSEERYLQRLDVGLFALQRICVVLAFLCGPSGQELKVPLAPSVHREGEGKKEKEVGEWVSGRH